MYLCDQCGAEFTRHYNLMRHIERMHREIIVFQCYFCGEKFQTWPELETHRFQGTHNPDTGFYERETALRGSVILYRKRFMDTYTFEEAIDAETRSAITTVIQMKLTNWPYIRFGLVVQG